MFIWLIGSRLTITNFGWRSRRRTNIKFELEVKPSDTRFINISQNWFFSWAWCFHFKTGIFSRHKFGFCRRSLTFFKFYSTASSFSLLLHFLFFGYISSNLNELLPAGAVFLFIENYYGMDIFGCNMVKNLKIRVQNE